MSAVAAALIVVGGAAYALLSALARLRGSRKTGLAAAAAYALLATATVILAQQLGLEGAWLVIVAVMLIGYLLAPHAIWQLSVATHANEAETSHVTTTAER